jgi:hypothetical protein
MGIPALNEVGEAGDYRAELSVSQRSEQQSARKAPNEAASTRCDRSVCAVLASGLRARPTSQLHCNATYLVVAIRERLRMLDHTSA